MRSEIRASLRRGLAALRHQTRSLVAAGGDQHELQRTVDVVTCRARRSGLRRRHLCQGLLHWVGEYARLAQSGLATQCVLNTLRPAIRFEIMWPRSFSRRQHPGGRRRDGRDALQAEESRAINAVESSMRHSTMSQPRFRAVAIKVRIVAKRFAPSSERKQPETFIFDFITRSSCSPPLLV